MKYHYKLSIGVIIASLCLSIFLFFPETKKKELTIGVFIGSNWDVPNSDSYRFIDEVIQRYKKQNKNVSIRYISGIQKEDYSEWIAQQSMQGKAPDVFFVLSEDLSSFQQVGLLEKLDSYITKDGNFSSDAYYKSSYLAGKVNDSMYALPYESVPNLVFVNKTLLEKEGIELPLDNWTWDDFYRISKQVTKDTNGDGKIDQFGSYGYSWQEAIFSNGGELFSDDGSTSYLNSDQAVESIEFIRSLQALNDNNIVSAQDFDEGNVVFCLMPFSQYRAYRPYPWKVKKYSNFEWDCISLPSGPKGEGISEINTLLLGINANSSNKKEAWELLKAFSYNKESQFDIFKYSQGVSVLKEVTKSDEAINFLLKNNPGESIFEMRLLNQVMEHGKVVYPFRSYQNLISMIDTEIFRIINSKGDIFTEMKALQQKIATILKE